MTQVSTFITAVSVYPDRARVTRSGKVTLAPGMYRLEIEDLPLTLDPDSLRASARGTAQARLAGVQAQRSYFVETPAERVRELENQYEELQDKMRQLDTLLSLILQNRAHLDQLAGETSTYAMAIASGERSIEAQMDFYDSLRKRAEQLNVEQQSVAKEKRTVERHLQKVKNELDQQHNTRPRQRYTGTIEVEVLQDGELLVDLVYVVSQAGWKPLYDMRLLEMDGQASLEVGYLGQVSQKSGEDWVAAALTLSTARPALAGKLPELDPWYLEPAVPAPIVTPPMKTRAAPAGMRAMAAPVQETDSQGMVYAEVEETRASVDASGATLTYRVPGKVNIPSDGNPHKVVVARFSLPPRLDYVAAPKLVQAAYRRARLINDSPYVFLPGKANLFTGEEFIGAAQIELTAPEGELELYLGTDDRLKVERELKRRDVDKSLIGGRRRVHYGYEITVENLLPSTAQLTLHDQLPLSRHEDVKVRLDLADPKPSKQSELNLLEWEFALAPKEKRFLRFNFSVEYPQDMDLGRLP